MRPGATRERSIASILRRAIHGRISRLPATEGPETAFSSAPPLPEGAEFASPFPVVPGKKVYQRGMRSMTWESGDENSDTLRFDLFYRGEDEKAWKPLSRGVKENYFAWDSTLLPDGRYR